MITFYHSALGVFSSKKGVLKLIKFPIALMPSVQRGPIDFSGDGLVGDLLRACDNKDNKII